MGRKNTSYHKDLREQAHDKLMGMQAFGQSKKDAVASGTEKDKIFSYNTYQVYWKHTKYFIRWIQENHPECTTLKAAKKYVSEWLQMRIDQVDAKGQHLSAWTIHTEIAALSKLFGIDKADPNRFQAPQRRREDIIRSRVETKQDRHFSITNNFELVEFCRGTGCRRSVLEKLEGRDFWTRARMEDDARRLEGKESLTEKEKRHLVALKDALQVFPGEKEFLHHRQDKGGRSRFAPIIGKKREQIIERIMSTAPRKKVWIHVPKNMDVHAYRAEYATSLYRAVARDIKDIPYDKINKGSGRKYQSDVYTCRKDEAGKKLDKRAMRICSKALGHNRISVIADHYLRGL